ncbi:glycerophosphoryl diester phosphodiesterase [Nitrosospira briensis]|nr:glycerophosphoryl diester phosphodiesterase [Nitrosospira briensis]
MDALRATRDVLEKHQAGYRILVTSFRHDLMAICASVIEVGR